MSTTEGQSPVPLELRSFLDRIPTMAWSTLPDGSLDFCNQRFRDYAGLPPDQLYGSKWKLAVYPGDIEKFESWWQNLRQSQEAGTTEVRLRRYDGSHRWFLLFANPLRDESCNLIRWYGINIDIDDRQRAEENSRARELSWRQIVDDIPGLVATMGATGEVEFLNRQTLEFFGKTNEELKHWALTDAVHPDDLPRVIEARIKSIEQGRMYEVEHRCRRVDGVYRWFQVRGLPVRDKENQKTAWYLLLTDIDDRKRAEQALQQTQFYLSEGQRLAHMGSWAFNASGFDYWSPELLRVYGLDPSGKPPTVAEYLDLVHPEDREFMRQGIQKMLADHLGFDFTKRIVRPDGNIRHVRCVGIPVGDEVNFRGFIGTGMDVTEQEQLMQKLRQSEEDLRTITDSIRQPIVVLAPDGTMLYANRVALDNSGLTLDEVKEKGFFLRTCHPDDVDRVLDTRGGGLSKGIPFDSEMRVLFRNGQYRWQLLQYNPLKDVSGQIIRWYVTATDIDDRKRTEDRLQNENLVLREEIDRSSMFEEIVGSSKPMSQLLKKVEKVAPSDSTVLILGDTGTGKELIARALHRRSKRASRAFIKVNCAAIPQSLIASELFGHEKGAFTGALQRRLGRFEAANGGTLFLDEIGELPMETQIALLRVLQEREFERVGSNHPISVDVRLIAATNRDLPAAVAAGTFRQDLFYRLNVFPIAVPPLRERAEDIPLLVEYFVARFAQEAGKNIRHISKQTLEQLQGYRWPGNIRELQNVVERAVILSETDTFVVDESWIGPELAESSQHDGLSALEEREVEMIESALAETHGRISGPSGAAAKLGIPRQTLESKIRRLGLDKYGQKRSTS